MKIRAASHSLSILFIALILASSFVRAQSAPQTRFSRTTESLRGVSAVSQKIAWASGTHGTYLRTTDGRIWIPEQVPGAESLDFRAVVAFSAEEAFLMSAGSGDQSRIYHTADAGRHWQLQFTNTNPKGFFDSMVFWDRSHGVILGDPVPDESGVLKFELLMTDDGQTWNRISSTLPPALEGEGAFAASNSCLAILHGSIVDNSVIPVVAKDPGLADATAKSATASKPAAEPSHLAASAPERNDSNMWFATGGKAARVFHSPDRGRSWQVFDTPIAHGPDSEGIFSIAFRDPNHGVIAGGDYKHPEQDGPNLAFTTDGGKSWTLSKIFPQSYYSAVAYDRRSHEANVRLFLVGPKFIYDFRPPANPTRISPRKKSSLEFNAVSPYPSGGALFVGPKGSITTIP